MISEKNNQQNDKSKISSRISMMQTLYEFLSRISSLISIAVAIFSIFFMLMQIRQVNVENFFIRYYDIIINVVTVFFVLVFIEQIRLAPRMSYLAMAIFQFIAILALNILSKRYYSMDVYRVIWTIAGSILFFLVIVINWLRLSYSRFTLSQMIISSFIFVITLGTLLLYLPMSTDSGRLSFINALFTATSAVCVTGLSVIDVSKELTFFGQIVLMSLIQIGGLGIMSISAILLLFSISKGSVQDRVRTLEMFNTQNKDIIRSTVKIIFISTFTIELIGAVILFTSMQINNVGKRIFFSIFHSISAFCNAGFSLYSDNLHGYAENVPVILTVGTLIVLGGIGYPVILTMSRFFIAKAFRRKNYMLDTQTIIVLFTTITLILAGSLFIFFNEYSGALLGLTMKDKILSSVFQSISPRTAGFESVPYASMNNVTLGIVMFLMFVGASPSGTGGGIKTTTLFVFLSSVITAIKNRPYIIVAGRKIPDTTVNKSVAIVTLAISIWFFSALIMFYIEKSSSIFPIMFECVSAMATVGLSLGITAEVTTISKCILIALMFIGRVGYLTLFISIGSINKGKYTMIDVPTGDVTIG